jgi:hypothetical protein
MQEFATHLFPLFRKKIRYYFFDFVYAESDLILYTYIFRETTLLLCLVSFFLPFSKLIFERNGL